MEVKIYQETISNDYLHETKEIRGTSPAEVKVKAEAQLAIWARREKREKERADLDELKELAEYDTLEAEGFFEKCGNILRANLNAGKKLDWVSLYDDKPFSPFVFKEPVPRYAPIAREMGVPKKSFFSELFVASVKKRRVHLEYEAKQVLDRRLRQYEEDKETARTAHAEQRAAQAEKQSEYNRSVDQLQLAFEKGHPDAIESFARIVLTNVTYPDAIEVEFDVQYDQTDRLIVINTILPTPDAIPRTLRVQYHEEEHGITAVEMEQNDFDDFYESVLLQITLSSIHMIFQSVKARHIQWIGFNGRVINDESKPCVLSCKVSRDVFGSFDLAETSPRACFLSIKGVLVEPLTGLSPVQPAVDIKRTPSLHPETDRISTELNVSKVAAYQPGDFKHLAKEVVADMFDQIENDLININQPQKTKTH